MTVQLPKAIYRALRHRRTVSTWVVLLAFAAIAVPGQGLHLLPGMGHFHGAADGGGAGQAAQHAGWNISHDGSCDHEDGCPICHFATAGKIVPHAPACVPCDATVTYLATADRPLLSADCDQPFYARGPPRA